MDALADMARERSGSNWWDEFRDSIASFMLDLVELEHHAVSLRHVQITHLPGLLQHEEYARAVFGEAVPPLTSEAIDLQVDFRMRRRALLDRPDAPRCSFLLHEAALRMLFGDRAVVRLQLQELLKYSERDSVVLRVVPFTAGGFPSAGSSTMHASGPVRQLDTVQIDVTTQVWFSGRHSPTGGVPGGSRGRRVRRPRVVQHLAAYANAPQGRINVDAAASLSL
ncbi:DUF5753 domain-containing protein [Streptomyces rubiginosohelvolus]|uniref:DUF5753 domain-containing protein n=1 Tax=Streptomyces rubiginosohelvolus TaxID=67362 RepID=UPI0033A1F42C